MWALVRFAMSKVVNMSVPLGPRLEPTGESHA